MQTYRLDRVYKSLVVLVIVVALLVLLKDIFIPIAFSALFAVVLLPLAKKIEARTGRIFSIVLVLLGAFLFMALVTWFVISQLTGLVASLPSLEEKFYDMVNQASYSLNQSFNISTEEQTQMLKDGLKELSAYLGGLLLSTSYLLYFFIQVPIYIFLFLLYRDKFRDFFLSFTADSELKWKKDIEGVIRSYISGLMIVVLIAGTLNSIGLLALGIEHAIFFGFLSGTLTMIPYIGISIGAALPTIIALLTKDNAWYAVGVIAVHGFVQFLEGNFITPKVTGSKISINAMAAILALLIGGKIWGIAGMILAVPGIGIAKILFSYSPSLRPLVILLEDKSSVDHSTSANSLAEADQVTPS
jgi:predicted PurR-regulated permease PerM